MPEIKKNVFPVAGSVILKINTILLTIPSFPNIFKYPLQLFSKPFLFTHDKVICYQIQKFKSFFSICYFSIFKNSCLCENKKSSIWYLLIFKTKMTPHFKDCFSKEVFVLTAVLSEVKDFFLQNPRGIVQQEESPQRQDRRLFSVEGRSEC